MLHDLANDGGFVGLKWAAEDRQQTGMEKGCQIIIIIIPRTIFIALSS